MFWIWGICKDYLDAKYVANCTFTGIAQVDG